MSSSSSSSSSASASTSSSSKKSSKGSKSESLCVRGESKEGIEERMEGGIRVRRKSGEKLEVER